MRRSWHILAAVVVASTLAIGVGTATAETLWIIARRFQVAMRTLTFHADGTELTAACPVTLEGSFAVSSFVPTARTRLGTFTRASLGTCSGGSATILSETLPWTIQYDSFGGTLPNITSMTTRIIGASFRTSIGGIGCLARSEEAEPLKLRFSRGSWGELPEASFVESSRIRLTGGGFCEGFSRGYLTGSGTDRKPESEGEPELYLNGRGGALAAKNQAGLVDVDIPGPGGTTRTLTLVNKLREGIRLDGEPRSSDTNKFTIVTADTTCSNVVSTLDPQQGNECDIKIRRENGAAANDRVEIRIRYYIEPTVILEQWFYVRAT